MKKATKTKNGLLIPQVIFIGALLVFIIAAFVTFAGDNRLRVLEQNNSFIEAATEQTSSRIHDMILGAQKNVRMMAHLYGTVLEEPKVDAALLQDMTERSSFDYVEFISADGTDLTADGRTADLSDRVYFQDGMLGNSGKCVIHNSRITNETLLIFYTPFYYGDELIGVLSGILKGDTFRDLLSADYFGIQVSTYLLERDGGVIFSVGDKSRPDNLLDNLSGSGRLSEKDYAKLAEALGKGLSTNFNYKGKKGEGSAYITAIGDSQWLLVQNFPSSLTEDMTKKANTAGIRLEVKLFAAFLVYILYLVLKNRSQKELLVSEKQEMSQIVEAVTQLFSRFAVVDYEADTYEYLEGKKSGAPEQGMYTELIRYLGSRYVPGEESAERMDTVISQEYVQKHLTREVPYLQFEYQIDMDGIRWENLSVLCLKRENGLPVNVLYAIQDVTALKERELQIRLALKNASEAAEAANRAKSDFLARMSHDIRTPMNAIMGMTAVAAMHMDDPERLGDCLNKITISSRHLLALINDVLDMSKIESGKVSLSEEPFGMADMVESILTIMQPQVNSRRQNLKVHISDIEHEHVIGDTLRIRQVFVNILGNAVKFTPEGGTISFSIRECPSLIHGMACFEFVCEDTGVGMDEEFIQTIFDPFTRSRHSVSHQIEGTGLGMSITRNIVRMMEGDLTVKSQLGVGSVFTVRIHLKPQNVEAEDIGDLADLRVLVADDDQDSGMAACEILEGIGMHAEWVSGGTQAVERILEAEREQKVFSAVILDWQMPGMDGVETARRIRSQAEADMPILILSAYDWTEIEAEAREAGVQAFIEKPLFRSRLIYALKSVFAESGGEKELELTGLSERDYSGRRVLLVEDNELNREIAEELLSVIGVTVEQAGDGREAVEMVKNHPPYYYDLIFMDIQMPVMNGYDAARGIRALGREDTGRLPIVAMSANAFADDIRDSREAGMNDHVAKPVEIPKLLETLDKWL